VFDFHLVCLLVLVVVLWREIVDKVDWFCE